MVKFDRFVGLLGLTLLWTLGFVGCGGSSSGPSATPISTTHDVVLTWNASTSAVVRYNVYRSIPGQGYSLLGSVSSSRTTYTDSNVSAGASYNYVVTAVDSAGVESPPTNAVTAVIPTS